jgi:hypothetical protein
VSDGPPHSPTGSNRQDLATLLAALTAGGRFSRLRFHLVQAWFFPHGLHVRRARQAGRDLARTLREALPSDHRSDFQDSVCSTVEEWLTRVQSEPHCDYLAEYEELLEGDYEGRPPAHFRNLCSEPLNRGLEELRQRILSHLSGQTRLAWDLGVLLGEGLCPATVIDSLDRPGRWEPLPGGFRGARTRATTSRKQSGRLATQTRDPGVLAPAADWLANVRQLFQELQIEGSFPPELADQQTLREVHLVMPWASKASTLACHWALWGKLQAAARGALAAAGGIEIPQVELKISRSTTGY